MAVKELRISLIMEPSMATVKRFESCRKFRALALRWIRSDEGLTLETSAFESLSLR